MGRGRRVKSEAAASTAVASKMKTIAIDVDGTIANTHELMLRIAGYPSDINIIGSWDFLYETLGGRFWPVYKHAWGDFEDIRPTDYSVAETINRLGLLGYVVDIVTCRPLVLRDVTAKWLARNGIRYNRLVVLPIVSSHAADMGLEKLTETSYNIYVDDNPHLAEKSPRNVILYDRPWNRGVSGVRRIMVFSDLFKTLGVLSDAV